MVKYKPRKKTIMFTTSENADMNYRASIVRIDKFSPHPGADRLKIAHVFGNSIVTGINSEAGLYCYFPLESAISADYLKFSNSFTDSLLNDDTAQKGFFSQKCRVRATRLRGEKSEGYIVPVSSLEAYVKNRLGKTIKIDDQYESVDFDTFMGSQFVIKYFVPTPAENRAKQKTKGSVTKYLSRLVEGQFHFHADTAQLRRNIHAVNPDDTIEITEKYHGTSVVVANVLVKRVPTWKEKVAKFFGIIKDDPIEYGLLYSSRAVLKNKFTDL